jgi:AAA domain
MVRGNDSVPRAPPGRAWDARQRDFLQRARLWSSTAVLGEAGCGKSTALLAAVSLWRTGRDASEVVILCPMEKAAEEWAEETGLNVLTVHAFFCVGPQPLTENALRTAAREPDGASKDPSVHHLDTRRNLDNINVDLRSYCSRLRRILAPRLSFGCSVLRPAYVR